MLLFLFLVSCVLIPWNLWLTYSRGGWASALVMALVFLAAGFWRRGKIASDKTALLVVAAVSFAAIFLSADAFCAESVPVREVTIPPK